MNIFDFFFNKKNNKIGANTEKTNKSVLKPSYSSKEIEAVAIRTYSEEDLELNIENFIRQLKHRIDEAGFNSRKLRWYVLSDKTYEFYYLDRWAEVENGMHQVDELKGYDLTIGRMKITKKSSEMCIYLRYANRKWLKNKHMIEYLNSLDKWISRLKYLECV